MVDTYIAWNGKLVPLAGVNPPSSGGGGGLFPGDPGPGLIMWGQTRDGGVSAMPARAAQYASILGLSGHKYPGCYHRYSTNAQATVSGATSAVSECATIQGWGNVYAINDVKEPAGTTFAQVGAGAMDSVIDTLMEGLVGLGLPACVQYHNEPAGDGIGGAVEYGSAIKRFAARRDAAGGKGLITVTGALGIGSYSNYGGSNGDPMPWIQEMAPYCDVWNTHRYLQALDGDSAGTWNKSMDQLFGQFWALQDSVDNKRARFHTEWGVHTWSSDLTFAPKFMDTFMAYGIANRLRAACFFDSGQNSHGHPWDLDLNGETSRLNKFAHQLADPRAVGPAAA